MGRLNWRDPGAYAEVKPLDAPGFAWEYLCRNAAFLTEMRLLKKVAHRRALTRAEEELFALRWGVRFRWVVGTQHRAGRALDRSGSTDHRAHRRRCCNDH